MQEAETHVLVGRTFGVNDSTITMLDDESSGLRPQISNHRAGPQVTSNCIDFSISFRYCFTVVCENNMSTCKNSCACDREGNRKPETSDLDAGGRLSKRHSNLVLHVAMVQESQEKLLAGNHARNAIFDSGIKL